jgi:cytosine/adenosine deaminase-related metal-dependent hydrolase
MHLAESAEELELLATGGGPFRDLLEERSMWDASAIPRDSRPLDYLRELARAPRSLVVHGNFLAGDEIEFLAGRRATMGVAYCPRTHAYFGHAPHPVEAMLAAGVPVALGTDSRASNPDLNMLAELQFAARRHPRITPEAWLRIATLNGAIALGLGDEAGSLAPGKRADMIAVACGSQATAEPHAALVDASARVSRVWIGGTPIAGPS